jgi:alpha/beta superfamily hydrolase
MCPACASVGMLAIAGVVSTAGLTGLLVKLRAVGGSRGKHNVNPREMSS